MVRLGWAAIQTTLLVMLVPEAAVDEDHGMVFREDKIGLAGQILPVQPETEPQAVGGFPDRDLRFHVLAADRRHITAALRGR